MSDGRARGLILHGVFGTFVVRPHGLFPILFLPESLIRFTCEAGTGQLEPQTERNPARR